MLKHKIIAGLVLVATILTSVGGVVQAAPNRGCPPGTLPAFAVYQPGQGDYIYFGPGLARLSSFEVTDPTLVQEPNIYRQDILATANDGHLIQKAVNTTVDGEVLIDDNINMSSYQSIFGYTGPGVKVERSKVCVE